MIYMKRKISIIFILSFILILSVTLPVTGEDTSHTAVDTYVSDSHAADIHTEEAGNSGQGHSTDRSADLIDLRNRYINFGLLVIILIIVFRKTKILSYFSTRSEEIKKKLEDLKRDKDEAERKYREVDEQLKNFESKKKDIIEQYRQEGLTEKDKIVSEAKKRVKQIIEQSEITIQQEIDSARNQLKQDIIEIASQKAQDILVKEIDGNDQKNMVVEFVEKVGNVN